MKIAVVGAGAIGGYLGGWLAAAGEEVTFIARGANLEAIRSRGMRVIGEDGVEVTAKGARAHERVSEAGAQDLVLLTVRRTKLPRSPETRASLPLRDRDRHDAERHSLVVLPQARRGIRRPARARR